MPQVCSICVSAPVVPVGRITSPVDSTAYTLYYCDACGSRSFDLHEHDTDLVALYERLAPNGVAGREFRRAPLWDHEVLVLSKLLGRPVSSVLDAGCTSGDFLLHWPGSSRRVGVELSTRSAAVARQRGLTVHQGRLEDTELGECFDVVTCYAILEHLAEPRKFLERLEPLVGPSGVLAIMVPSFETAKPRLLEALGRPWHMNRPPEHLNLYSRRFLDDFFDRRGFELAGRRYTSGGMFNPLRQVPGLGRGFARLMWWADAYTPLGTLPIFDHMYSYYRKKNPAEPSR